MSSPTDLRDLLEQRHSQNMDDASLTRDSSPVRTRASRAKAKGKAKPASSGVESVSMLSISDSASAVASKRISRTVTNSSSFPSRENSLSPPVLIPVRQTPIVSNRVSPSGSGEGLGSSLTPKSKTPVFTCNVHDDIGISLHPPSDPEFDSPPRTRVSSPTLQERKRKLEEALAEVNAQVEEHAEKRRRVRDLRGPGFPRTGFHLSDEEDAELEGLSSGPLPQGPEVPWKEIIALGRHLHGLENPVEARSHPRLLGDKEPADPMAFPLSHHVEDAIKKAFCVLAGNDAFDFSLPLREFGVTSRDTPLRALSASFDPVFHVDESAGFSAFSAKPSPEETALLRDPRRATHSSLALSQIESLSKRSLLSLSTLNWLLGSLQNSDPEQHAQYIPTLWWFITRVLMSSMELSASTFALSLQARRLMFLNACDHLRVPDHLKPWLALRSPFARDPRPPLLGGSLEECRVAARENREVTLLSSLTARPPSNYVPRGQQRKPAFQGRRGGRPRQQQPQRGRQDGPPPRNSFQGRSKGNSNYRGASQKPRQRP